MSSIFLFLLIIAYISISDGFSKMKTLSLHDSSTKKSLSHPLKASPLSLIESGLCISLVIAFHEAGHFLAAKLQGNVEVLKISIT